MNKYINYNMIKIIVIILLSFLLFLNIIKKNTEKFYNLSDNIIRFENEIKQFDYSSDFVFITSSYNQNQFVEKNLNSIKNQNYPRNKFRIIYINDNSTDNTEKIVRKFMNQNKDINIELINNEKNMGPAYSRYISCKKCEDNEICVFLDGDDFLVNNSTLSTLSYIYNNYDIYATFGSMLNESWQYNRWKMYIRNHKLNYYPHLRTARADICKKIPIEYLKYKNQEWFEYKSDVALFISIIELCNYKFAFVKNVFVEYNNYNNFFNNERGYNNSKRNIKQIVKRNNYNNYIRNLKPLKSII